jgi:hypothetical protein
MKLRLVPLASLALAVACTLAAQTPAKTTPAPATPPAVAPAAPAAPPAGQPADATPDPWAALRFLLGAWQAKTTGGMAQAQTAASYAFRLELRDHVLARHTRGGGCQGPEDSDCLHGDMLYIYPTSNGQAFSAIYFDNEGHVIHYDVTTPQPMTAVFLSDPAQPGPQYRLTYSFVEDAMNGKFEFKLPGQADFTSYLEWSGKQQ